MKYYPKKTHTKTWASRWLSRLRVMTATATLETQSNRGKERTDLQAILLTSTGVTYAHMYDTCTRVCTHKHTHYIITNYN